jgi:spore coat protein A, manganese oxidase
MSPTPNGVAVSAKFFLGIFLACAVLIPQAIAQQLDSATVTKWVTPLPIPHNMTPTSTANNIDYYEIKSRQIQQHILPPPFPPTTVWAYGQDNTGIYSFPGYTVAAATGKEVQVKWINDLICKPGDTSGCMVGNFVTYPASVPVDTDIHWANPPQACAHGPKTTDCKGNVGTYQGPVPTIVHVHGDVTASESDGIPEAWNLASSANPSIAALLAAGYKASGSDYCQFDAGAGIRSTTCAYDGTGSALFDYKNDLQGPGTLFYHDHSLGVTLQNVYMGLVGFYLISGGPYDVATLPSGSADIGLAIQAKSFTLDGKNLLLANAEGIGNISVVNGASWPFLTVKAQRYRFRVVNANTGEDIKLQLPGGLSFQQIGNDAGFLPHPVKLSSLRLSTGERADVIVDFSKFASCAGNSCNLVMINDAADLADSRQVLQFKVTPGQVNDPTFVPGSFPQFQPDIQTSPGTPIRSVSLFDDKLGTCAGVNCATASPLLWDDGVTEIVETNSTEIWDIYDFKDSHPIHLHEVQFQVVGRLPIGRTDWQNATPPSPGEAGFKDTVEAHAHQVTRIKVRFEGHEGLFAWHCHIAEHEDAEMMRPLCIVPAGQFNQQSADAERFCAPK